MELILRQDVQNLGFKDDIVTVKNGYGRNFLIPQKVATLATPSARKVLAENIKQRAFREAKLIEDATKIADSLKAMEIKITAKTGDGTKLFGSINNADLVAAISKEGQEIEKKFVKIPGNTIKRLGKYTASIRLHREVVLDFSFEIISE